MIGRCDEAQCATLAAIDQLGGGSAMGSPIVRAGLLAQAAELTKAYEAT